MYSKSCDYLYKLEFSTTSAQTLILYTKAHAMSLERMDMEGKGVHPLSSAEAQRGFSGGENSLSDMSAGAGLLEERSI